MTTTTLGDTVSRKNLIVRQGDVLIRRIATMPAKLTPLAPEHGRLILARGEATGHHHSIPASAGTLNLDEGGTMYLTIDQLTSVDHQEHASIPLEPGVYQVVRQREYAGPERTQYVGD